MYLQSLIFAATLAAGATQARSVLLDSPYDDVRFAARGAPEAPNGYTPTDVDCPSTRPSVRDANTLSSQETAWLQKRRPNTVQPMMELFERINIPGFDVPGYLTHNANNATALPNIGIAASGGGYRALMNGAGALAAFDSRTPGTTSAGGLGGLLQSATYLSGLSGGSWLVGSLYQNNFTSVAQIIAENGELWDFTNNILQGPGDSYHLTTALKYYHEIYDAVQGKNEAGYETTITDYWGRALSYQLINATEGGPSYTWSSLVNTSVIVDASAPLPLVIADNRAPNTIIIPTNTTIIEFNPWEMGSWDPSLYAFAPIEYVGSNFTNGQVPNGQSCVRGFDNAGYVMGTSSTLFNQLLIQLDSGSAGADVLDSVIQKILSELGFQNNDIADWAPNPFYQYRGDGNPLTNNETLTIVDGGENGENIPLHPLVQPFRDVDVIFAIDSSADDNNWPSGTAMMATYQRASLSELQNHTAFPSVPDNHTFINLGLNQRPTFFGCDPHNNTNTLVDPTSTSIAPLIVYLPNSPYSFYSNLSTFNISVTDFQRDAVITNGLNVASRANNTINDIPRGPSGTGSNTTTLPSGVTWDTCVGCAILQRSLYRNGEAIPSACNSCFEAYCWNGQTAPQAPAAYEPTATLANAITSEPTSSPGSTKKSAATSVRPAAGLLAVSVAAATSLLGMAAL